MRLRKPADADRNARQRAPVGPDPRLGDALRIVRRSAGSARRTSLRIGPGGASTRVGSGKLANPCLRMHSANLSASRNWLSVALTPPAAPPGASRAHALRADLNAGACGLIPVPARLSPPPPSLGSGKVGTPLARMQSANFSPREALPWPVVCDDPHPATATTQPTTASQPQTLWLPGVRILLLPGCTRDQLTAP